jgi:hypothetical protein
MKTCEDCGCRLREGGLCTNCHEELYIYEYQADDYEGSFSDEFMAKVQEQRM